MRFALIGIGLALVISGCSARSEGNVAAPAVEPGTTQATIATESSTTTKPVASTTEALATVAGKVIDPWSQPLSGASVEMEGVTVTSGPDGFFDLQTHGPGTLHIRMPGRVPVELEWDEDTDFALVTLEPRLVRGIRVGPAAAGDDAKFGYLLDLAANTAINSFVFDTKQEDGKVVYDTSVADAVSMGAEDPEYDARSRIAQARDAGIYTITRVVAFEDPIRVRAHPEEKLAGAWLDPRSPGARDYVIGLALEACELGFDEIQFDYVRFPAGRTATVSGQLSLGQEERVAAIEGFLEAARAALRPLGCAVSADIFAIVVSMDDDQGLGQRPEELSRHLDALSPMVYPSHYSPGWLGYSDPNDHPYEVTSSAIDDALPRVAPGTMLRPWLQAFWWSNSQIRSAIQAAEDRDVGWILWNVSSNYDADAIPADSELASS